MLELGAGCGLVGLAAGVLGAKEVLLTDLPYALPNMQANLQRHEDLCGTRGMMMCHALDWYDPPSWQQLGAVLLQNNNNTTQQQQQLWIPQVILVADCVWMQELVEPLLSTLETLTGQSTKFNTNTCPRMKVLISYQQRGKSTHEEFWNGLHTRFSNATLTEIDVSQVGLSKPDVIHLLRLDFGQDKGADCC